jgi:pyruvate/2-oxoglutarate dehydrogenase complex dihydrolipoamide dehydrogenase (E3) component
MNLLVLGSGAAGKFTLWTLAKEGMNAAIVERKYNGGTFKHRISSKQKHLSKPQMNALLLFVKT